MSATDDFPEDLLDLQHRWYAAEAAWAADPTEEKQHAFADIGAELHAHPYWATTDNRHKAIQKLKRAALDAAQNTAG
ncbi:hypothetical protein ACI1MP_37250 (plasmid) [Kitasatospora griseola]|uniref:hypothetical protein n=1 Tax=Kitasatospora griseola TaxID=2064 RepID=UPI003855FE43